MVFHIPNEWKNNNIMKVSTYLYKLFSIGARTSSQNTPLRLPQKRTTRSEHVNVIAKLFHFINPTYELIQLSRVHTTTKNTNRTGSQTLRNYTRMIKGKKKTTDDENNFEKRAEEIAVLNYTYWEIACHEEFEFVTSTYSEKQTRDALKTRHTNSHSLLLMRGFVV